MSTLKVSLIQSQLTWHKVEFNLSQISKLVSSINEADLIVLPEMWSSGFTMKANIYHSATSNAVELMQEWAVAKQATICGSLITKDGEAYYNRLYCVGPEGVLATYDKRHLFGFAGEDRSFRGGDERQEIAINGFNIRLNVCYDLRFPVWSRNDSDYDILLYVANWPDKRIAAWQTLLRARAIENQTYVIGCNCVGEDLWSNTYSGHSAIIEPDGQYLAKGEGEQIMSGTLALQNLKKFRKQFPFLKDRDEFKL